MCTSSGNSFKLLVYFLSLCEALLLACVFSFHYFISILLVCFQHKNPFGDLRNYFRNLGTPKPSQEIINLFLELFEIIQ